MDSDAAEFLNKVKDQERNRLKRMSNVAESGDEHSIISDILTKGNFTRDEWNDLLCLFNISHFSSTVCSDTMTKRSQQDSGGERVTAKSRPMMNLIASTPSHVSSSTSVSPGREVKEVKIPGVQLLKKRSDRDDLILT